jgi:hypothetical protein
VPTKKYFLVDRFVSRSYAGLVASSLVISRPPKAIYAEQSSMGMVAQPTFADDKAAVEAIVQSPSEHFITKANDGIPAREEAQTLLDSAAEKKLVRKLDIRVILPIGVIFFWAFIDRVNLGYAKLQGLEQDLGMTGNDFNVALLVQIAPYIFFEIPSNLILKHVRPSYWLGGLSLCWGFMTLGQGLVKTYSGLIALRIFLGLFEAGLVPGKADCACGCIRRAKYEQVLSV